MGEIQGRLYDRVQRSGRYGVNRGALVDYVYSDREDGGPDNASRSLDVHLLYLNRKLRPIRQEITQAVPSGPYVLRAGPTGIRPVSALTTPEREALKSELTRGMYPLYVLAFKYRLTKTDMTKLAKEAHPRAPSAKTPFYYRSRRAKEEVPEWPT
jgi:hypothetical protein